MAHLHTKPNEHDLTASAYILLEDRGELKMWFHLHRKLNKWLQFGGHVEHIENPWAAILHEIEEEAGYLSSQLKLLQPKKFIGDLDGAIIHPADVCINTHHFPELEHYHTDIAYAFVAEQRPSTRPQKGESQELKLLSRQQIVELEPDQIPSSTRQIALYIFDEIHKSWVSTRLSVFKIK